VGQADIVIKDSTFIDVENALVGGIVSGLNQNGKLLVVGSSFTNCHNTKIQQISLSNKQGTQTNITSGDATFKDTHFDNCDSEGFGGAISYINEGVLLLKDCKFKKCISLLGKGGALYVQGSGEHTIKNCQFSNCIASGGTISEGGSVYIAGGTNYVKDSSFKKSTAQVTNLQPSEVSIDNKLDVNDDKFTDQSQSFGGAIMIIDWQDQSFIKDTSFKDCVAGTGGAVYINSVDNLIPIQDVTFTQNIASVGGGGALFAVDTSTIKLHDCEFKLNQALLGFLGNDLHFETFGTADDYINISHLQYKIIDDCSSSSIEPRVCFSGEYGCQVGWIPDSSGGLSAGAIVLIVLVSCILSAVIVGLCLYGCYKFAQKQIKNEIDQQYQGNQGNDNGTSLLNRSAEDGSSKQYDPQQDQHQNFKHDQSLNQDGSIIQYDPQQEQRIDDSFPSYPSQNHVPSQQPQIPPPLNLQMMPNPVYGFPPPIKDQQISFGKDDFSQ
ncbi:MAG: hypothetical protein EZS28_034352, partial [Streblomastix strix]